MASMNLVILLLGPSGVGKSFLSKGLEEEYSFRHFQIHEKSFERNGFPAEWDADPTQINFAMLASIARNQLADTQHGAVLSLPTEMIFSSRQLEVASREGVCPVVLLGRRELCFNARRERHTRRHGSFGEGQRKRYWRHNTPTFEAYERAEYERFRIDVFHSDDSFRPREEILRLVVERGNQPLKD